MEAWFQLQTLIWLFPIVFIFHDFEEIIYAERWFTANTANLRRRLPKRWADRVLEQFSMSTAQFAVAVLVVFLFVSSSTYMANQYLQGGPLGNLQFFVVCTLVLFLHIFTHLGQAIYFRSITPGSITSLILLLPYSLALYHTLLEQGIITWSTILLCLPYVLLAVPVVLLAHKTGKTLIRTEARTVL
jgi:hypothetical protein